MDGTFYCFDIGGWRDKQADFHLDKGSHERAEKRAKDGKAKRIERGTLGNIHKQSANCTIRASLGTELANFKAIIRHVIAGNADPIHQCLFTHDNRSHIRRLSPFAIIGHQPVINATRITTEGERRNIETAILRQRIGTTPKQALATMRSLHARRDEGSSC